MKIVFIISMLILSGILVWISFMLFRHSKIGWIIWGGIAFSGLFLLSKPVSDFMDPLFISSIGKLPVKQVISAREFTVPGWLHSVRRIVLTGTRLPTITAEQDKGKTELLKILGEEKHVVISFPNSVRRMPEPWPANVTVNELSLNEIMLTNNFLLPDDEMLTANDASKQEMLGNPPKPMGGQIKNNSASSASSDNMLKNKLALIDSKIPEKKARETEPTTLPKWGRYILWTLFGFVGATSLGMVLNKRYRGFWGLSAIVFFAIRSIILSIKSGDTIWPQIICLIIIVLFAGSGRIANKEFLEKHPDY